jgi:hypothetical protein
MKWIRDETGTFRWRPYYDREELDIECERIVSKFLEKKYGISCFPISTDDLSVMVEQDTSDLDLYADLSGLGEDVEGLTDFFPHKKPVVKIARELSLESWRHDRLRTTLAHEYGHVKFHTFLWDYNNIVKQAVDLEKNLTIQRRKYNNFRNKYVHKLETPMGFRCRRDSILEAPVSDWMEWQASYVCGAFLMPLSLMRKLFRQSLDEWGGFSWIPSDSEQAGKLTGRVAEAFDVSTEAARVRLFKLGFLQKIPHKEPSSSDKDLSIIYA